MVQLLVLLTVPFFYGRDAFLQTTLASGEAFHGREDGLQASFDTDDAVDVNGIVHGGCRERSLLKSDGLCFTSQFGAGDLGSECQFFGVFDVALRWFATHVDCAPVILWESVAEPLVVFAIFERLWHVLVKFVDGAANAGSEGMEAFLLIPFDGRQPGLPLVLLLG